MRNTPTKKRRINREIDRTPLTATGKKKLAKMLDYYRRQEEAAAKGAPPPPLPPGFTRSPLDVAAK